MLISNTSTVLRLLPVPFVFLIYYMFTQLRTHETVPRYSQPPSSSTEAVISTKSINLTETASNFNSALKDFWQDLAVALEKARPHSSSIVVQDGHPTSEETTFEPLNMSKTPPERLVNFTDEHERDLLKSHYNMRVFAQKLAPRLVFSRHKYGIVATANTKYMPIFLVSLRMLRRTGCQLPVEVFIDDWKEYDSHLCEIVLPSLNAACVVLSTIYLAAPNIQPLSSYQFKLFATLFSSFQHVLFLDSDAFPAHDPTSLLSQPPYTSHGLIVWPDLFGLTISTHYYHVAGIPYESPSTRASTESGVFLLDKEKHRASLLMMIYYNYYGPEYYYPLLCQGSHGAGDKETFVQAAMAVGAPWYQVKTGVAALGYFEDGNFRLSGMAQADPKADFEYKAPSKSHIHPEDRWKAEDVEIDDQRTLRTRPKPLFVHQHMHKLDPGRILSYGGTTAKTHKGNYTRMWGELKGVVELFGYDVERRMWEVVVEEGCRVDRGSDACLGLTDYFTEVFGLVDSIDE
ncbi:mannosyltransferase [Neodidymelliopsis sp. IMI 364377]|nr:mannosyltransferase [Neodidymelliopsis sp. IMI 364377]